MINLSKKDFENILQITLPGEDFTVTGLAIDSREVVPNNLFATWHGDNFDGTQFCNDAVLRGAAALLIDKPVESDAPQIIVADVIDALAKISAYWRSQFDLPVIGVTGSNGKTTVKNMLRSILKAQHGDEVIAPIKSFNNHIGVPLTLAKLSAQTPVAVIEMGMNHFGEIAHLANLAKPTIAVITNAGLSHIAGTGSIEGVAKAKGELIESLTDTGIAILNADDHFFDYWKSLLTTQRVISFGLNNKQADIFADEIQLNNNGCQFDLITPTGQIDIQLKLLGQHNVMNALAAAAAAYALNTPLNKIQQGLTQVEPEFRRLERKQGKAGALLIDDSYNANPNSMRKAIDVLAQFPGRRILVMGDMLELGPTAEELHAEIGTYAKQAGIDDLFATGDASAGAVKTFGDPAKYFSSRQAMADELLNLLNENAVVLIKASNGMQYNRVVTQLER